MFFLYLDTWIIKWLKKESLIHILFTPVEPAVKFLSNGGTLIGLSAFLILLGFFIKRKQIAETGKVLLLDVLTVGLVVQVLKHLVSRARPSKTMDFLVIGPAIKKGFESFPSGHAAVAFSFAYLLSAYYPPGRFLFYSIAFLAAFERIENLHHFPSDLIAGAVLGLLLGKYLLKFYRKRIERLKP